MTTTETLNLDYRRATMDAHKRLSVSGKYLLSDNITALCDGIKGCGQPTALEILAAVGRLMVRSERQQPANG